jgi:hypothetical protein
MTPGEVDRIGGVEIWLINRGFAPLWRGLDRAAHRAALFPTPAYSRATSDLQALLRYLCSAVTAQVPEPLPPLAPVAESPSGAEGRGASKARGVIKERFFVFKPAVDAEVAWLRLRFFNGSAFTVADPGFAALYELSVTFWAFFILPQSIHLQRVRQRIGGKEIGTCTMLEPRSDVRVRKTTA